MPIATPDSYPGVPGTVLYAGLPSAGSASITTLVLENESASTQAANFITKSFGLPLQQGVVEAGTAPQFELEGGTACPASIGGVATWPDGSMKFCTVMLRIPASIAGSGTLNVLVKTGGTMPSAGARITSNLTPADLKMEVTGVSGLTGTWAGELNDAITVGADITVVMDGAAGKIWRIGGDYKQSGSAHGQIYATHYVAALTNSSNGLFGLRYLHRCAQPWGDVASPAVATRVVTAVLKTGATTIRTMQGHNGSETVGANISMDQYTSFFSCGAEGRWDYVQGGGSSSTDCTVRVRYDPAYIVKTRLMPPYNTALAATSNSSVSYVPYCRGHMLRYTPNSGERDDIGLFPSWVAKAVIKQTAVDERAVRVNALAAGGWRIVVRQQASKNVIACADIQASYTGMGTMRASWRHWPAAYMTGLQNPGSWASLWAEEFCSHHRASPFYYAYMITGEAQYADMMAEMATVTMLNMEPNTQGWSTTLPITNPVTGGFGERGSLIAGTTYKGAGLLFRQDSYRIPAWGSRDIAHAAALLPDAGTLYAGTKDYCRDVLTSCWNAAAAYNNAMSSSWRAAGLWSLNARLAVDEAYEGPWALGYLINSVAHQSQIVPETGAATFRAHLAKLPIQIYAGGYDVACLASYRLCQWNETARIDTVDEVVCQPRDTTLTPNTGNNTFSISGPNSGWTPANGDVFMFSTTMSAAKPFAAAVNDRRLYAVEVDTGAKTFKLALTRGGSAITVTSGTAIGLFAMRVQSFSPRWSYEGYTGADAYVANWYGVLRHLEACGESVTSVRTRQDALLAASGTSFVGNPKNAFTPSYPS